MLRLATKGFITADKYKQSAEPVQKRLKQLQEEQSQAANRAKNWYEVVGNTLELLTNATEKFALGNLNDKKEILLAIGQNPVIIDQKLQITLTVG